MDLSPSGTFFQCNWCSVPIVQVVSPCTHRISPLTICRRRTVVRCSLAMTLVHHRDKIHFHPDHLLICLCFSLLSCFIHASGFLLLASFLARRQNITVTPSAVLLHIKILYLNSLLTSYFKYFLNSIDTSSNYWFFFHESWITTLLKNTKWLVYEADLK